MIIIIFQKKFMHLLNKSMRIGYHNISLIAYKKT